MNWTLFYRFLLSPFKTIAEEVHSNPKVEAFVVLVLLGLFQAAQLGKSFFVVVGLLYTLLGMFMIFVQSLVLDFTAQCFKFKGQSLHLYHWLALSCMPMLANIPLYLLHQTNLKPIFLISLFGIFLTGFTITLQVSVVKHLYKTSLKKALFIYFMPLLIVVGAIGLLVILGSFFAMFLFRGMW
jgi:hypothetical protein